MVNPSNYILRADTQRRISNRLNADLAIKATFTLTLVRSFRKLPFFISAVNVFLDIDTKYFV